MTRPLDPDRCGVRSVDLETEPQAGAGTVVAFVPTADELAIARTPADLSGVRLLGA